MTNNVVAGTTGGTILGVVFNANLLTTCIGAIVGATLAFFISLFWRYLMSGVEEKTEIREKLKALIPLIQRKRRLNNKIDKLKKDSIK